jgi:hypothetical protein
MFKSNISVFCVKNQKSLKYREENKMSSEDKKSSLVEEQIQKQKKTSMLNSSPIPHILCHISSAVVPNKPP